MYSFQLTKNIVGIDIGSYSLKVVECQRAGEKVTLLNYEIRRLPKPAEANGILSQSEISAFIRQTLKEIGIKTSEAVSELTGPWMVARHLFLPDLADEELREAIRWGSKSDFPFSLEEAIIDFHKIGAIKREDEEPEVEIIAAVATRQVAEEQIALLKEAGVKPLSLSIPSFDLMQAYRFTQETPWSETAAVIDLGHKSTQIIVLKEGNLKFSRKIAVAGDAFTQSLTGSYGLEGRSLEIDEPLAEQIKLKVNLMEEGEAGQLIGGVPWDQVQKRLGSVMDRLLLEVERSLNYYKTQFKDYEIKRVLLTGGGSLLEGLPGVLEKNLEIPVESFRSAGSLTLRKKINEGLFFKNLPFLAISLGLVSQAHPFINLIPQYLVPQTKEIFLGRYLKPVLVGALPLGVLLFFGSQYWAASREVSKFQKEIVARKGQLDRVGKTTAELAKLEQEEGLLNKALEGLPKIETKRLPLRDVFQELSRFVPPNMTLTRFNFSKAQEASRSSEQRTGLPKSETANGKTGDRQGLSVKDEGDRAYQLVIQGIVFGSDQEIISTLSDFTQKLNRSDFFKESKVQMTLKSHDYSKGAAEFRILAGVGDGPAQTTASGLSS